jgi:hypothetical protein
MTVEEKSKVPVGKALYLEFRRNTSTYQLIITPAGKLNVDGVEKEVDGVIFRRLVSESTPRSQWRTSRLRNTLRSEFITTTDQLLNDVNDSWMKSGINYQISSLGDTTKWSLYKQPVAVEASEEDLKDALTNSTPNALIKRIRKAREALGFDESFYASTTPAV